jgi:hypothetical protein
VGRLASAWRIYVILIVIAMVMIGAELEHHEQIADRRGVYRAIGIVFVRK